MRTRSSSRGLKRPLYLVQMHNSPFLVHRRCTTRLARRDGASRLEAASPHPPQLRGNKRPGEVGMCGRHGEPTPVGQRVREVSPKDFGDYSDL
jgi:hypothetical protein